MRLSICANGPLSFTRTLIFLLLSKFTTSTTHGSGSVLCAAVMRYLLKMTPVAVGLP